MKRGNVWAVVVVAPDKAMGSDGGAGSRATLAGQRLDGLQRALRRAHRIAEPSRVLTVVTRTDASFWAPALEGVGPANLVVQPHERDTGVGLLLTVLRVFCQDPAGTLVVLSTDQAESGDAPLLAAVQEGLELAGRPDNCVALLAHTPDAIGAERPWVVPLAVDEGAPRAAAFVDRPGLGRARALREDGALWRGHVVVGRVSAFFRAFERAVPKLFRAFIRVLGSRRTASLLDDFYTVLPPVELLGDIVERVPELVRLVRVGPDAPAEAEAPLAEPGGVRAWAQGALDALEGVELFDAPVPCAVLAR